MPAPPNCCGTDTPRSPRSAICGRMAVSKWCARSSSRIRGATARAAHSRTVCSSSSCSSVRLKVTMTTRPRPLDPPKNGSEQTSNASTLSARDDHPGAAADAQPLGGASAVDSNLEETAAAEQRTQRAWSGLRVGSHDLLDRMLRDRHIEPGTAAKPVQEVATDIRHEIAEAIDAENFACQMFLGNRRFRHVEAVPGRQHRAERSEVETVGKPRRRRRKTIAPLERTADCFARKAALRELDNLHWRDVFE